MNKKETIAPFILIGLGLAFTIVSFAVFLSNGKSKKWVSRKMKIGGLLLTLSAVAYSPSCTTCYDMPTPPNYMSMNNMSSEGIELMLDTGNVLQGVIEARQGENFSFSITTIDNNTIQKDLMIPLDGKFDSYGENFKIVIDTKIPTGTYSLKLYDVDVNNQIAANLKQDVKLMIKNNKIE